MQALILSKITGQLPSTPLNNKQWSHTQSIDLADPYYHLPGDIDVLIGTATYADIMKEGLRRGKVGEPIAQCSKIGWIVYGQTPLTAKYAYSLHVMAEKEQDNTLENLLSKFWSIEEVPNTKVRSKEEIICEQAFIQNTRRNEDGRYIVRIPIARDAPPLGESRQMAMRRFLQMETRFTKNPELRENYIKFMREYEQLTHMREAPPLVTGTPHFYIPHHAALGAKKFGVVFDGSAKTSNGVALNDIQLTGEKLQNELTSITMRFRTHRVALTADIAKMYRQVLVPSDQLDYQRILWREYPSQPIKEYHLLTQTYGLRSAPHN